MPSSWLTRRARLRSRALMEPMAASVQTLQEAGPGGPVTPLPDAGQALLEGAVFSEIRTLHCPMPSDPRMPKSLPGVLDVRRLRAQTDSLTVTVGPEGPVRTLGLGLFPYREVGEGGYVIAPGMRLRERDGVVEIYRPGATGVVRFRGIQYADVLLSHREVCPAGQCMAEQFPDEVTHEERTRGFFPVPRAGMALSAMVRRLGILRSWGATSIDTWPWRSASWSGGVIVEAWFPSMDPSSRRKILEALCSENLEPHWFAEPLREVSGSRRRGTSCFVATRPTQISSSACSTSWGCGARRFGQTVQGLGVQRCRSGGRFTRSCPRSKSSSAVSTEFSHHTVSERGLAAALELRASRTSAHSRGISECRDSHAAQTSSVSGSCRGTKYVPQSASTAVPSTDLCARFFRCVK